MNLNLQRDVARALASHHFELADDGRLYVPAAKAFIGGVFRHNVNGADERIDPNLLPTNGLIDILNVYFKQGAQRTAFYLAPFSGNVDPVATLTGANFTATQTEFNDYSEGTRPAWTPPAGALAAASIDNGASPGVCTISVANSTVWGFGLLTTPAKDDVTGLLVACSKFATARSGLQVGDKLNVEYTITATDAG